MFRDLLSSRWFQGGLAFFLLCVGSSLLYNWHVQRTTESDMERRDRFLQGLQKQTETRSAETVNVPTENETPGLVSTPDENADTHLSDEAEALPNETETPDFADAFLPDDMGSEETPAEEVPVSPFGFGPYPELPEGWSPNTFPAASADHELQKRVRIKLISQGVNVVGTTMENDRVYPIIQGTAYVEWKSYWRPTGNVRYISNIVAHPDDMTRINAIRAEKGRVFAEADVPSDIKLVSFEEGAIDPYDFLELP
ncbi:hypothetical protein F4X90_04410 [Candidatus Poribacteria bacterium]|nr:hypothetical protein [Candidatus Poribacteria bacterium]